MNVTNATLGQLYFSRPSLNGKGPRPDLSNVTMFAYARQALVAGLKSCNITEGKTVLLPNFICRDVLSAIHAVGAKPLYFDVNERFEPASDSKNWPDADAVLAINFFGIPQDLRSFLEYQSRIGALIIEDNAHGFLSRDEAGLWLGTRADCGLFSFRKSIQLGGIGAGLYLKNAPMNVSEPAKEITSPSSAQVLAAGLLKVALSWAVQSQLVSPKWISSYLGKKRYTNDDSDWFTNTAESEETVPSGEVNVHWVSGILAKVDTEFEINRRRVLFERLCELSNGVSGISPIWKNLGALVVPYMFAFRPADANALNEMTKRITNEGLRLIRWPDLPRMVRNDIPSIHKNVWAVPFMW